jgi:SAM-dependent methyltransferase
MVAIDAAPEMTEYANRQARRHPNCRFQPGTAESLDFPEAAFDVLMSSQMMHHLPEEGRLRAVREMRRMLRRGGTLLLADVRIPDHGIWHLVASLTGHKAMERRVPPLEPLVDEAGFHRAGVRRCAPLAPLRQGEEPLTGAGWRGNRNPDKVTSTSRRTAALDGRLWAAPRAWMQ